MSAGKELKQGYIASRFCPMQSSELWSLCWALGSGTQRSLLQSPYPQRGFKWRDQRPQTAVRRANSSPAFPMLCKVLNLMELRFPLCKMKMTVCGPKVARNRHWILSGTAPLPSPSRIACDIRALGRPWPPHGSTAHHGKAQIGVCGLH